MIMGNFKKLFFSMAFIAGFVLCATARADMTVLKAYKQAFPDTHPKCISCHVDALPKKADGQHEWNAYGQAAKKAINTAGVPEVPTADNIDQITGVMSKVGKIEDFKGTGK